MTIMNMNPDRLFLLKVVLKIQLDFIRDWCFSKYVYCGDQHSPILLLNSK